MTHVLAIPAGWRQSADDAKCEPAEYKGEEVTNPGMLITLIPEPTAEAKNEHDDKYTAFIDAWKKIEDFCWDHSVNGLGEKALKWFLETREQSRTKGLKVQKIIMREAIQFLTFPYGPPQLEIAYLQHPVSPLLYYPVAKFHRLVFEHKVAEAVAFLSALGANEISVAHVKGWSRATEGSFSCSPQAGKEKIEVSIGAQARAGENFEFRTSLQGHDKPVLLEDLVWYPHESTWQMLAKLRMEHGMKDFSLKISYEDDFQVNANLAAVIEGTGLQLGGKFEKHQSTEWILSGNFGGRDQG